MKAKYSVAISIRLTVIFLVLPSYLGDYFVPFLKNLTFNLDIWSLWLNSGGDDRAFPYGVAMLVAYIPSLVLSQFLQMLAVDPIRALEIAVGLQMLAIECLLWWHLQSSKSMKKSLNIFLFSPLIIWVNYFLGLNDFFPSACLFFGSYLLLRHKYRSAGLLIGIAIGMKFSLALVLPFLILFAWDNPRFKKSIWITTAITTLVATAMYGPAIYSMGFRKMVLNNKESAKALDFYLSIGSNKILVLPVIYLLLLYWLWKAGRISLEVLIAFFGIALFLISAFSPASIGWMLWGLPLMFMNLAKEKKSRIQLVLIQTLFLVKNFTSGIGITTIFGTIEIRPISSRIADLIFTFGLILVSIWTYSNLKIAIRYGERYKVSHAPLTVSIAGDSGTGKDTLSYALINMFTPNTATILCGDDYHKYERADESWNSTTHLNPTANYLDLWERDYKLAYRREYFERREYDHETGKFSQLKPKLRRDLLVSQGLHALYERIADKSDLRIFLSMDDELRIKLKLHRDNNTRGQSLKTIRESINKRKNDYQTFVFPQKIDSDINFHLHGELESLRLRIASTSNFLVDNFIREVFHDTQNLIFERTEFNTRIYEVDPTNVSQARLKEVLKMLLPDHEQLFLQEPTIPDGALGIMATLTIMLVANNRDK